MRDESFINPHFVIRDAGSLSGLQASRLPYLRLEVGSSKGQCRQPTCCLCAGYNRAHTAAAGRLTIFKRNGFAIPFERFFRKDTCGALPKKGSGTRNIAERFNNLYGETFVVPEPHIVKSTQKIASLADPMKKMSKSDENPNATITVLDDRDTIMRKFKRAVTDSGSEVRRGEGKEGIENLMSIYGAVTEKTFDEIEREFEGKGYGDFKTAVGEAVADSLAPLQERYKQISADKSYLEKCMKEGAEKAYKASRKTLQKVSKKVGFIVL